jgi:hypothetical protein
MNDQPKKVRELLKCCDNPWMRTVRHANELVPLAWIECVRCGLKSEETYTDSLNSRESLNSEWRHAIRMKHGGTEPEQGASVPPA